MTKLDGFFDLMARDRSVHGRRAAESSVEFLLGDVVLAGRRMLTIEPAGWFGFYAGCRDAARVFTAAAGSAVRAPDGRARWEQNRDRLGLQSVVHFLPEPFPGCSFDAPLDIILVHDALWRFDEDACERLNRNLRAIKRYKSFLKELFLAAAPGATLIVSDYSRYNLFPFFHLPNPFAPGIRWEAHHSPSLWSGLFTQVGFDDPRVRWETPGALGTPGRALFGNVLGAYFYKSHFRLTLSKSRSR